MFIGIDIPNAKFDMIFKKKKKMNAYELRCMQLNTKAYVRSIAE